MRVLVRFIVLRRNGPVRGVLGQAVLLSQRIISLPCTPVVGYGGYAFEADGGAARLAYKASDSQESVSKYDGPMIGTLKDSSVWLGHRVYGRTISRWITASRQICKVKQRRAELVLGRETTWEYSVSYPFGTDSRGLTQVSHFVWLRS